MATPVENTAPLVLGVIIATLAVGGIFIFFRTITRTVIRPQFGWDDALIIITWFIILGYNTAMFVSISHGYGKHITDIDPTEVIPTVRAQVVGQVFAIASFPSGKASVAYLLLRLFPGKKLKWILWSFVAGNAVFFYIDAILIITQCQPVEYQWDQSIKGGSCWNPKVVIDWGFLTGVFGAVTDFVFAILPWFYIGKLKMGLKEKISTGVALSAGFFAGVCSILKIYYTWTLGAHADFTFDTVPLVVWSCAELALINVAACIPTLRPLYLWLKGSKSQSASSGGSDGYPSRHAAPFRTFRGHSARSAQLISSDDDLDRKIYQFRTYEVRIAEPDDMPSDNRGW